MRLVYVLAECPDCEGQAYENSCLTCDGTGSVEQLDEDASDFEPEWQGDGRVVRGRSWWPE